MDYVRNPKVPVRHVPADQERRPEDEQIAYLIRVPSVTDRPAYRRAVKAAGGRQWSELDLYRALADGVRLLLADDADAERRDYMLGVVEGQTAKLEEFGRKVKAGELDDDKDSDDLVAAWMEAFTPPDELKEIELAVTAGYERYAQMVADRAVFPEIAGIVGARMFLAGWEGLDGKFRRSAGVVPDDVLAAVPSHHFVSIGELVGELLEPPEPKRKNLSSPSSGAIDPTISTAASTQPETVP